MIIPSSRKWLAMMALEPFEQTLTPLRSTQCNFIHRSLAKIGNFLGAGN